MEQQSDNNLDALFQKAAEEYPLKTNNRNWDIVAAKLHTSPTGFQTKKSKKWQYSVLLLLLLGGSLFIITNLNKRGSAVAVNHQRSTSENNKNESKQQKQNNINNQPSASISTDNNNDLAHVNAITKTGISLQRTNAFSENKVSLSSKPINKQTNDFLDQIQPGTQPKLTAENLNNTITQLKLQTGNIPFITNQSIANQSDKETRQNTDIINNHVSANNRKSKHVSLQPQPKTFYGMFFFSPDFATIKFQHINKPGYSIGIGLGYRINNRFSAEIGLQRVHANFYSDGKYFDTSNINMKRSRKLDALNGNSKLTEIPVALKYNLLKNNNHFFATGGTTVALMTHTEKYDYNVIKKNGAQKDVYRKFNSTTGTKFFSSVNVSLGYQTSVSNFFDVKIEPYFQAATKGLGIGNLPINNFGVNIGIMKDLK
jgi:hypothetical protein